LYRTLDRETIFPSKDLGSRQGIWAKPKGAAAGMMRTPTTKRYSPFGLDGRKLALTTIMATTALTSEEIALYV
jgi:hypothetical protein